MCKSWWRISFLPNANILSPFVYVLCFYFCLQGHLSNLVGWGKIQFFIFGWHSQGTEMIVHGFLFRRQVICSVAKCIFHTQLIYQTVYVMWFTHTSDIVRGLASMDNNIFVMKMRQVFCNILVITDRCCASSHWPIEFLSSNKIISTTSHYSHIIYVFNVMLIMYMSPVITCPAIMWKLFLRCKGKIHT